MKELGSQRLGVGWGGGEAGIRTGNVQILFLMPASSYLSVQRVRIQKLSSEERCTSSPLPPQFPARVARASSLSPQHLLLDQ